MRARSRPTPHHHRFAVASTIAAVVLVGTVTAASDLRSRADPVRASDDADHAQNVILLIGDGMGTSEITAARNYTVGADGRLTLDSFVMTGQVTTYSVLETDPSAPDYDPESASTATAWSTGEKTADGRISTAAGTDADLPNLVDVAEGAGLRTGIVTTAEVTDATPAAPMAHVAARACQGPADMERCPQDNKDDGGPGSIAEQSIDHGVDVILGGGRARYEQLVTGGPSAGGTVIQQAQANGYRIVDDRSELLAMRPGRPVLGLFTAGTMSAEWSGAPAVAGGTAPQRCLTDQRPSNEPSLAEMTRQAIALLSGGESSGTEAGFLLQVEGASIDKRAHAAEPCHQIGETIAFDRAVEVALDFARRHGDTLVIVTADHAQAGFVVDSSYAGPGLFSTLITDEGQPMVIQYGTAPEGRSQQHTGGTVPIMASGPHAGDVTGLIDQTEIFRIIVRALGLSQDDVDTETTSE